MDCIDRYKLRNQLKQSRKHHANDERENNLLLRCEAIVNEQPTVDLSAKLERITSRYEEERNILLNSNLEYTPNNVLDIIDYIVHGD